MSTIWADRSRTELVPNNYVKPTICRVHLEIAHRVNASAGMAPGEKRRVLDLIDQAYDFGKRMDTKLAEYRNRFPERLMTPGYFAQLRALHTAPRGFGASGHRWVAQVLAICKRFRVRSWLDYGCGQSTLWSALQSEQPDWIAGIHYTEYDPIIPGKDRWTGEPVDLITCTDVLEHIEPEYLDRVLKQVFGTALRVVFFNIALHPANKTLPDGRNAHLIQQPTDWWLEKIARKHWTVERLETDRPHKDLNLVVWTDGNG